MYTKNQKKIIENNFSTYKYTPREWLVMCKTKGNLIKSSLFCLNVQLQDDSIYNMSQRKEYSFPPPLAMTCNGETSELYQVRTYIRQYIVHYDLLL